MNGGRNGVTTNQIVDVCVCVWVSDGFVIYVCVLIPQLPATGQSVRQAVSPPGQKDRGSTCLGDWLLSTVLKSIHSFLAPDSHRPPAAHAATLPAKPSEALREFDSRSFTKPRGSVEHRHVGNPWHVRYFCSPWSPSQHEVHCQPATAVQIRQFLTLLLCQHPQLWMSASHDMNIKAALRQYLPCIHQPADFIQGGTVGSIKCPPVENSAGGYVLGGKTEWRQK